MDVKDEALVAQVIAGDVDAYGTLMQRYETRLTNYVTYLLGTSAVSADAVQETFIKAYQNLRTYDPKYPFSSWIYRIAHNTAINLIKKYKHESFNLSDTSEEILPAEVGKTLEETFDDKLLGRDIMASLQKLDIKYREPLLLHLVEHKSYKEIADILEMSVDTVATRIHRAKKQVQADLRDKGIQP